MKKQSLLVAVSVITILSAIGVSAANAAQPNKAILESCVALLPHGHKFEFNMDGKIDTTAAVPKFEGGFGLSDGSNKENLKLQQQVLPFVECVKAQLRK